MTKALCWKAVRQQKPQPISKRKKEEIESNLILFGLALVLLLAALTFWHVSYKRKLAANLNEQAIRQNQAKMLKRADFNQDGVVDAKDAQLLKTAFWKNDATSLQTDLNQDGKVDGKDFSLFATIVSLQEQK